MRSSDWSSERVLFRSPWLRAPAWTRSSVVEHCVDIAGVASSILAASTIQSTLVSKVQGFTARHIFGCNNVSAVRVGQDETRPNDHCPTTPPLIILGGRRAIAMARYSEKRPSTPCALVQDRKRTRL